MKAQTQGVVWLDKGGLDMRDELDKTVIIGDRLGFEVANYWDQLDEMMGREGG